MNKEKLSLSKHLGCTMGGAGLAEFLTLPLDTIKTHTQTHLGISPKQSMKQIYTYNGMKGFYQSSIPAVARQMCSSGVRLGLYSYLDEYLQIDQKHWSNKVMLGITCGLISNFTALPFDVIKTKVQGMQGSHRTINTWQIPKNIWESEGLIGFYRGFRQTAQRICIISAVQLPVYFEIKERLKETPLPLNVKTSISATVTTIAVTTVVYPIDVIKTLVQNHNHLNQGTVHVIKKIVNEHGIISLYRGWSVGLGRALPNFLLTTILFENLKKIVT